MSNEELSTREIYDKAISGFANSLTETIIDMVAEEVKKLDHTQYADAVVDKLMKEEKFLNYMRKAVIANARAFIGTWSMDLMIEKIVEHKDFAEMMKTYVTENGGPNGVRSLVIQELPSALEMYFAAEEDSD